MTLELDKKQYENLLKLASLGTAMANAYREEPIEEFSQTLEMLYNKAEQAGLAEIIEKDDEGQAFPTEAFEMMLHSFIEEYDANIFWDQLIESLVERDLVAKYGEKGIEDVPEKEFDAEQEKLTETYTAEFEEHDIDHLFLKK